MLKEAAAQSVSLKDTHHAAITIYRKYSLTLRNTSSEDEFAVY